MSLRSHFSPDPATVRRADPILTVQRQSISFEHAEKRADRGAPQFEVRIASRQLESLAASISPQPGVVSVSLRTERAQES